MDLKPKQIINKLQGNRWYLNKEWKERRWEFITYAQYLLEENYSPEDVLKELEVLTGRKFSRKTLMKWKSEITQFNKWHMVEEWKKNNQTVVVDDVNPQELQQVVRSIVQRVDGIGDLSEKLVQIKQWLVGNQLALVDKVNRIVRDMNDDDRNLVRYARIANELNMALGKMLEDVHWDGQLKDKKTNVVVVINEVKSREV